MTTILQAAAAALKADATTAALVTTYLGQPAIFADELAPPDAALPYILVKGVSSIPWKALARRGRDVTFDVHIFAADGLAEDTLSPFENAVTDVLDDPAAWTNTVTGNEVVSISVEGFGQGPYEPGITSRLATVRALLRKTG